MRLVAAGVVSARPGLNRIDVFTGTVTSVQFDAHGQMTWFAVTVKGSRLGRRCDRYRRTICSYSGVTFWMNARTIAVVVDYANPGPDYIAEGRSAILPLLPRLITVGRSIPQVEIYFPDPRIRFPWYKQYAAKNLATYARLRRTPTDVRISRTARRFVFYPLALDYTRDDFEARTSEFIPLQLPATFAGSTQVAAKLPLSKGTYRFDWTVTGCKSWSADLYFSINPHLYTIAQDQKASNGTITGSKTLTLPEGTYRLYQSPTNCAWSLTVDRAR